MPIKLSIKRTFTCDKAGCPTPPVVVPAKAERGDEAVWPDGWLLRRLMLGDGSGQETCEVIACSREHLVEALRAKLDAMLDRSVGP